MGLPFFTWRPHQAGLTPGDRETIDLPHELSDLQILPRRDVFDQYSIQGGRARVNMRAWIDVRIQMALFTDRSLFRKLRGMINHLERGGHIAFGNDATKAFYGQTSRVSNQGATSIFLSDNLLKSYHSSAPTTLSSGDEFVIESIPPKAGREYHTSSGMTVVGSGLTTEYKATIADSLHLVDFYNSGSSVRNSDFFPFLIMPSGTVGSPVLTHDRRISYTLDITLSYVLPFARPRAIWTIPSGDTGRDRAGFNGIGKD